MGNTIKIQNSKLEIRNKKHGYTMIEMLIVVAAVLIMASLLFPGFKKMRDHGKKAKCLSNLRQLGVAMNLYMQDDRQGRFPGWTESGGTCNQVKNLPTLLWSYLGQGNQNTLTSGELFQFLCPSNRLTSNLSDRQDSYGNQVDYSINCSLMGQIPAAEIGNDTIATVLYDQPVYPSSAEDQVHLEGTNFLFADGHTEWITRSKINASWSGVDQYAGTKYDDWGLI